jgi:hypothetical protein
MMKKMSSLFRFKNPTSLGDSKVKIRIKKKTNKRMKKSLQELHQRKKMRLKSLNHLKINQSKKLKKKSWFSRKGKKVEEVSE